MWAAEVVSDALWSGQWPDPTDQAGFPESRAARYVAWAVLLAATALRPLLSAHAVAHLAGMVGPAMGAAALVALAGRLAPDARPGLRILGGLAFGLSPVTLGAALSGQVENTQTWILPGLLWLTLWSAERLPRLLLVAPAWALAALTSPYLALMAALASPWAAWRAWRRDGHGAGALGGLLLAAGALLAARAWLDLGGFAPEEVLFRPTWIEGDWPAIEVNPLPVASVQTLLTGHTVAQARAMVIHQPYLGLALLGVALVVGGERRALWPLAALGVLLAMGPRLVLTDSIAQLGGHEVVLPATLARVFRLPLASGGQYYRAIVLAHLALAAMVACGPGPRWAAGRSRGPAAAVLAVLAVLVVGDSLRTVRQFGLPWPTWELPVDGWQAIGADTTPGGVLHLPAHSPQLVPNHPTRLAGRAFHGRPVSDMPRAWTDPPADALLAQVYAASLAHPTAELPPLSALQALGFRYVVVDLPQIPERVGLYRRARNAWGDPTGRGGGLLWWTTDEPPPDQPTRGR